MTAMEFVSAAWDARGRRFAAGAQDNSVQVAPPNATKESVALGIIGGDGTLIEIDNVNNPSRVYGCVQFLDGLGFFTGWGDDAVTVTLPLDENFPDMRAFPFFVQPWSLNRADPSSVVFWAAGTPGRPSAWYAFVVPEGAKSAKDIAPPQMLAASGAAAVFTFVAGGTTDGKPDPLLLFGVTEDSLLYRSNATGGKLLHRALPAKFAAPVVFSGYKNNNTEEILGPISHGKTASVAVSPADSRTVAVTGWPSVDRNDAWEGVWLSRDAGATWTNIFGDLPAAAATVGQTRPAGLAFVDFPELRASALIVGTASGPFVSWTDHPGRWARLGRCTDLPIVMVANFQHEPYSDVLVAATYGRGVYVLKGAKRALADARAQQEKGNCSAAADFSPASSARYFPPQK